MNKFYPNLFSPLRIKNIVLKNRIEASPMGNIPTHFHISSTDYGGISFYDKSLGGAAVLHVVSHGRSELNSYESNATSPFQKYQLDITQEQLSVAKQGGAIASLCVGLNTVWNGVLYGPSNVPFAGRETQPFTKEIMEKSIDEMVERAATAQRFGFDMILLDFAHDSIVSQFLAPHFNLRDDEYGGSLDNRMRFPLEAIKRVRQAVGPNYAIEMRFSGELFIEGSYKFSEALEFIKQAEEYIDIVNISGGMDEYHEANVHSIPSVFEPHMKNVNFAREIKEKCNVFVDLVGSIMTPEEAELIIKNGDADLVMFGRSLIADPFWPKKAQEGRADDIVPCLRCNYCYHIATDHFQTVCSVNPRYKRENRVPLEVPKAKVNKKVAVIGGGPAGMKAALVACERGHSVDLFEKSSELGGQLNVSDFGGNHKIDLRNYRDYLVNQINKSEVNVHFDKVVSREELKDGGYDAIIIAIGADPITPRIPGVDQPNVVNAIDAFPMINQLGQKIVLIGGGVIGAEIGLELAELGKDVSIVELSDKVAGLGNSLYRISLLQHFHKHPNLKVNLKSLCESIGQNEVLIRDENNQQKSLPFDNVIIATGMRSRNEEGFGYYGIVEDTYIIGDCKKVGKVLEATNDAYFIASNI